MPNSNKTIKRMLDDFYPYAKEYLGFNKDASISFASDKDNAQNPLGKTAYYDPSNYSVTVYTDNRHPKDIMRSVSHELVHHTQNCRGDLGMSEHTGAGYAQNDEHLREMEREAYEKGNLCFRDWEDGVKANLNPATIYEKKTRRSTISMQNFKNLSESFQSYLNEEGGYKAGDKVKDLRNDTVGTVVEPMAGGVIMELEDGTIVRTRDKFLEKVEGEPMQEAEGESPDLETLIKQFKELQNELGMTYEETAEYILSKAKEAGVIPPSVEDEGGEEGEDPMDDFNYVGSRHHYQESDNKEEYNGHLWENKIDKIVNAVLNEMGGDPVGPVEAQKVAELLQSLGFTLTRGGRNGLEDFLLSLEQSGDLNATPDTRRGAIAEYGDHETQAQGGMVSSTQSSDPELDQIADIVRTVIEGGGSLHDLKQPLEAEAFDVQATNRFIIVKTTNGDVGIASAKNVELSGDEELVDTPYGQLAVGRINQSMEEGESRHSIPDFFGSDEEKEMMKKMSNKEFYDYVTRDRHTVPDLKGDMGPMDGLEGPFQFKSGAVLYYDPKAGKYYDRGKDMYLDNEEASKLTMENDTMKSDNNNSLREKVKTAVMSRLSEMFDDDDMYGDEDPYMSGLEAEFPWLKDKKPKRASKGAMGDDDAAMAAAAADAAAAGEFQSDEEEEEVPSVTMREGNFAEYGKIDAEDGNPPSKIGQGDEAYMEAYNAVLVARGEEPLPVVQPDQAYLDALHSGGMKPEDHSYNMEEGEEEASHETTLRDRVMARVEEVINQKTVEEEQKSTEKHDDDPALKGDQDELPDELQAAIIDKDDDKEEVEEAKHEEEKEEVEEAIAANPEDFYRQLRNESRVVNRPEWNESSRNKRTSVLNERLMKVWFDK